MIRDPQALANNFIAKVAADDGRSYDTGPSLAPFDRQPIGSLEAAPTYGAHTQALLREIGLDDETIAGLIVSPVVGHR